MSAPLHAGHPGERLAPLSWTFGARAASLPAGVHRFDRDDTGFRSFLRRTFSSRRSELLYVAFFDDRHRYLGDYYVRGCGDTIEFRGRQLFTRALAFNAAAVLMVHNHPSGSALPSSVDRETTARLSHVGQGLDIELLDHLIVGGGNIYSMKLERLL